MPTKVNKIRLVGFRGATAPVEISFDLTKPVALVFGENGTGKSTIADAFDFVCNRRFGSLEDRSLSGQSPKSHLSALKQDPRDLRVFLCTSIGNFSAVLTKGGPAISPEVGCPDACILRRSNILRLLNAQPKSRFEELKSFITVPGIDKSENALRDACRTVDESLNEAVRAYHQAKTELDKLWAAEGGLGGDALQWAESEAGKDIAALESSVELIKGIDAFLSGIGKGLAALDDALYNLSSARIVQKGAQEKLAGIEAKHPEGDAALLKLLQDAKSLIASLKPQHCPVCEQRIEADALVARLDARMSAMTELSTAMAKASEVQQNVEGKEAVLAQNRKDFLQEISKLASVLQASPLDEIRILNISWADFQDLLIPSESTEKLENKAREFWRMAHNCWQPLLDHKNADQKSINQRNAIKGHLETHTEQKKLSREYHALSQKLQRVLQIVSEERKGYVEGILDIISVEVERLYNTIHPGEGIGKIRFYLKPTTIGSLEIDGHFQNVPGVLPQAYYSESHLDTLGICVFLALAKHFRTEDTIVVLDDVVTSVDGPHLDRFMALLHSEAIHFNQVIVMTHYRPWRDRYRWAKGPAAKTQVIELGPWTLQSGLQAVHFLTAIQELKNAIARPAFDRQAVASKAGIVLESMLDFITIRYRCSVPRSARNEYTLGDLASGVDSKLSKALCCRKPPKPGQAKSDVSIKSLIDSATETQWVRNCVGCHFHELGSEVSDTDVRGFAQSVLALADAMVCESCGALPARRPSGSYWQCTCGELELYPLVYPGADPGTIADEI